MNLLDGIKSADIKITKEVKALSQMVKDENLSMVDRIESFEDIMSIEIDQVPNIRINGTYINGEKVY